MQHILSVAESEIFIGAMAQGVWGTEVPQWGPAAKCRESVEVTQKLKQFAHVVYTFSLQKRSKFENFAQFTSWFLTSVFHGGAKHPLDR